MSNSDEFAKVANAHRTAIDLWNLASQQIYSRFTSMLVGNSVIIALIGLAMGNKFNIPNCVVELLIICGLVLCLIWLGFMVAGCYVELYYRQIAVKFEKQATGEKIAFPSKHLASWSFPVLTGLTVVVFILIYVILFTIARQ